MHKNGLLYFPITVEEDVDIKHIKEAISNSTIPEALATILTSIPGIKRYGKFDHVDSLSDNELFGVAFIQPLKYLSIDLTLPPKEEEG